jgi:nitroreductase
VDAIEALTSRISPARLARPGPSEDELQQMLEAAACAPDHGRKRPWRFIVIAGDARQRFGKLLAESLLRREPGAAAAKLDAEQAKALRAPLIVVTAAAPREDPAVPAIEQVVAVGAATQNLLIAAHAMGYGSFWRTGALAYDPEFKAALGLAPTDTLVGMIYIGTVEAPGRPRQVDVAAVTTRW